MKIFILRTFWLSKLKEGQFLAKKSIRSVFFAFVLIESKSIEYEKVLFSQMIKVCQKKISTFLKKKWIFGHFCDFSKITKTAKNLFFLEKGEIFFATP